MSVSVTDSQAENVIGTNTYFKGKVFLNGALHVDGQYEGEAIEASVVTIGLTGKVKANISAQTVTIGGIVIGNIYATDRVLLLSTAKVHGEIHTAELVVQKGVLYKGNCEVSSLQSEGIVHQIKQLYEAS